MASPQTEDGYITIATELWEALTAYRLPGEQMQCLMFIFRKTYGWKKKTDVISLSQFVEATGIIKQNVWRAIQGLVLKNIITVIKKDYSVIKKDYNRAYTYGIVKDFDVWSPVIKKDYVIKKDSIRNQKGFCTPLDTKDTTKDTIKETTKEKNQRFKPPTNQEISNFCQKQNLKFDIDGFMDHYKSNGWMVGKNKMKDWKAAVRNWARRDKLNKNKPELKARNFQQEYNVQSAKAFLERRGRAD